MFLQKTPSQKSGWVPNTSYEKIPYMQVKTKEG